MGQAQHEADLRERHARYRGVHRVGGNWLRHLKLPKNSVGRKQIKPNVVNSSKVKDGAPDRR